LANFLATTVAAAAAAAPAISIAVAIAVAITAVDLIHQRPQPPIPPVAVAGG